MTEVFFNNKKLNIEKLLHFGFTEHNKNYIYSVDLTGCQMKMTVTIFSDGKVYTELTDDAYGGEYVLHLVPGTSGAFVGQVKTKYQAVLDEISVRCFDTDVFKSDQAKKVIAYVREKYEDELEFLWQKFPDNAIWRRKDTKKWYAALLTVSKTKLGIESDESAEILDLRIKPEHLDALLDHKKYFPGYHMNKKHWYTICLDGSVPFDEICSKIDESYKLATK